MLKFLSFSIYIHYINFVFSIKLIVLKRMIIANSFFKLASPPDIVDHPSSTIVVFYSSAQFSCTARGFRLINIVWKKAGSQRLPFTAKVTNISSDINEITSVLTITEIIGYYSGQYFCEVRNSAGTTTSSLATLNVSGMRL